MADMAISRDIFRAYDVRGTYPDEIDADTVRMVANAAVRYLRGRTLVVGEDGRLSSPELRAAVIDGITRAGCDVRYIGKCTTPLFYYAVAELGVDGGIIVTASHNPSEYNGLKIVARDAVPLGMGSGLEIIADLAAEPMRSIGVASSVSDASDITAAYVRFLIHESGIKPGDIPFTVVVDAGNGVAGVTLKPLCDQLRIPIIPLRFRIDGSFPERSPDPARPNALADLSRVVVREGALLGVAFDGDADRLAVVDEKGNLVSAQHILALLWHSAKRWWHAPKVVYDLRFSRTVRDMFGRRGVRSMVGHTNISNTMRHEDAELGGETSGHYYFRAIQYMESSELAMLLLIKELARNSRHLSELVAPFMHTAYSGELTIPLSGMAQTLALIRTLQTRYHDGKQDDLDGLTVEYSNWWFNVRPSNTEPVIRLVVEANDRALMEEKIRELKTLVGPTG